MSDGLISIILPVYNQADHIEEIVEGYLDVLSRVHSPFEIVLVVNGSRDASWEICQRLTERWSCVRALHSQRGGWGLAVRLGIEDARGDVLCYTNSARTTPQDLLLLLLYAVANPNVVIKANRKIREKWQRRFGSLAYNLEVRALFDIPYWDVNGTPKVFPRQFERLLALTRDDDLIDAEFIVNCRQANYPLLEVPIFSSRRHGGKTTTRLGSAFRMYRGALEMWRAQRRASASRS